MLSPKIDVLHDPSGMYNLNPLTRFISGLLANEAHGLVINCQEEEL